MSFTLKPAIKDNFIDRETLLDEMITTLTNRKIDMGFALIAPRRVGKTSILREITHRLANRKDSGGEKTTGGVYPGDQGEKA